MFFSYRRQTEPLIQIWRGSHVVLHFTKKEEQQRFHASSNFYYRTGSYIKYCYYLSHLTSLSHHGGITGSKENVSLMLK
jgi:hypothetical protein